MKVEAHPALLDPVEVPDSDSTIFNLPAPLYALLMSLSTAFPVYLGVIAYEGAEAQAPLEAISVQVRSDPSDGCTPTDGKTFARLVLVDSRGIAVAPVAVPADCGPSSSDLADH